jgi:cytochrome c556
MSARRRAAFAALGAAAMLVLAGCNAAAPPPASAEGEATMTATGRPVASIIDLMKHEVDPSADTLWEAVASVATTTGMVDRKPATDAEWEALRSHAVRIAEASNLLMLPGRRIAHDGQKLEDEGVAGNFTQAEAQQALDTRHAEFAGLARALQDQAVAMIDAIDRRDVDAYLEGGGYLDDACEACHTRFWYPGGGAPPVAAASTGTTTR